MLNDTQLDTTVEDDTDSQHSSIAPESNTDNIQEGDVIERAQSVNENNFTKPTTPKRKRTRKQVHVIEDPRLEKAFQCLQQPEDATMIYAQHLANKLKQFQGRTRTLVEHAINQVIFDAEMGLHDNQACNLQTLIILLTQGRPQLQQQPSYDLLVHLHLATHRRIHLGQ